MLVAKRLLITKANPGYIKKISWGACYYKGKKNAPFELGMHAIYKYLFMQKKKAHVCILIFNVFYSVHRM